MSDDVVVQFRHKSMCRHNALLIDESLELIECKNCGERINAFFAIRQLMRLSDKWAREKAELELTREAAEKKTKTKCQHCGQMTKVRVNVPEFKVFDRMRENGAKI